MKLNKFLCILLTFFSFNLFAQSIDNRQFLSDFQKSMRNIIDNYSIKGNKLPIDAQIFDISKQNFNDFLTNSVRWQKTEHSYMAMVYFENFQVNNKPSSFCFILYDSSKPYFLNNYLKNTLLNYDELVNYLSVHEIAHCLYEYEKQMGNITLKITPKEHEQLADMYSMAYFFNNNNKQNAVKVIRQIKALPKDDIHHNPEILEQFFLEYDSIQHTKKYTNKELFDIVYSIFLTINNYK